MSVQPCMCRKDADFTLAHVVADYSGFLLDPDGNNVEAVCVPIAGSKYSLK
jgi:hypothetical protein